MVHRHRPLVRRGGRRPYLLRQGLCSLADRVESVAQQRELAGALDLAGVDRELKTPVATSDQPAEIDFSRHPERKAGDSKDVAMWVFWVFWVLCTWNFSIAASYICSAAIRSSITPLWSALALSAIAASRKPRKA